MKDQNIYIAPKLAENAFSAPIEYPSLHVADICCNQIEAELAYYLVHW